MADTKTETGLAATPCHLLLEGAWVEGEGERLEVQDRYTLESYAILRAATPGQVDVMLETAEAAFRGGAPQPYERGRILQTAAELVRRETEEFISIMQAEAGFTRSDAHGEVNRCQETLRLSAEEARRLAGEMVPIEGAPNQSDRLAFTMRVPLGLILAVTPFNSPLNTVTHKVAPAFAGGNAVILKPSSRTPRTACKLAEILIEAGMPPGFLSVLQGGGAVVETALDDERIRFIAFTGSTEVGRRIQAMAGLRRTQMELGSIAFTILGEDADLETALPRIAGAGYRKAGQVCTSVQIVLAHDKVAAAAERGLSEIVAGLRYGDPRSAETVTGPLISTADAGRVESWVEEAISQGARRLVGGARDRAVLAPTLLGGVTPDMTLGSCEAFGPVVCLSTVASFEDAVQRVNATPYGLATGVFTNRLGEALAAARKLQVGGVHINQTSSSRVDLMPYGGSKDSGFGREGPHYAIREMTEERIVTLSA